MHRFNTLLVFLRTLSLQRSRVASPLRSARLAVPAFTIVLLHALLREAASRMHRFSTLLFLWRRPSTSRAPSMQRSRGAILLRCLPSVLMRCLPAAAASPDALKGMPYALIPHDTAPPEDALHADAVGGLSAEVATPVSSVLCPVQVSVPRMP